MQITVLRAAFLPLGSLLAGAPAHAQLNQLEIKQPKVEAGEVEVEYLGDYHFQPPRRRFKEEDGSFVFDANEFNRQRHSLGIGYGLTSWLGLQVGVEAEQDRLEDPETLATANALGDLEVTEVQIEGTIVLVPAIRHGFGAAALFEHSIPLERGEARQFSLGPGVHGPRPPISMRSRISAVRKSVMAPSSAMSGGTSSMPLSSSIGSTTALLWRSRATA